MSKLESKVFQLGCDDIPAVSLVLVLSIVVLMVVFRLKVIISFGQLGHNWIAEQFRCLKFGLCCGLELCFRVEEDDRTILSAFVITLSIQCGRIMEFPEPVEKLTVLYDIRVKGHLNNFSMTGVTIANVLIRWVLKVSTHIPTGDLDHTWQLLKHRFNAPEAARTERCDLQLGCCFITLETSND